MSSVHELRNKLNAVVNSINVMEKNIAKTTADLQQIKLNLTNEESVDVTVKFANLLKKLTVKLSEQEIKLEIFNEEKKILTDEIEKFRSNESDSGDNTPKKNYVKTNRNMYNNISDNTTKLLSNLLSELTNNPNDANLHHRLTIINNCIINIMNDSDEKSESNINNNCILKKFKNDSSDKHPKGVYQKKNGLKPLKNKIVDNVSSV